MMRAQPDWGQLFWHLLEGPRSFRPRSATRCTKIIGKLYTDSDGNYELAREFIGYHLTRGLKQRFWRNVSQQPDPIVCDLVTAGITRQADNSFSVADSCRKDTAACHLPTFLHENYSRLQSLVTYLDAHKQVIKDQVRLEKVLLAVSENPQAALGQGVCWPLGDIIIALQVPDDALIWTLDADFELLATVLGLRIYES
ncbi:MAG: hypothetical protein AAF639_32395 [Chloroflexota bacterium]